MLCTLQAGISCNVWSFCAGTAGDDQVWLPNFLHLPSLDWLVVVARCRLCHLSLPTYYLSSGMICSPKRSAAGHVLVGPARWACESMPTATAASEFDSEVSCRGAAR